MLRPNAYALLLPIAVALAMSRAAIALDSSLSASAKSGIEIQGIDRSVRPQDDFYHYVNGDWLVTHEIPADAVRVSAASQVADITRQQIKGIVESAEQSSSHPDADLRKIGLLYASFMDQATPERKKLNPLRRDFANISDIRNPQQLAVEIGRLGQIGVNVPINNSVLNDSKNADSYIQSLYQSGLGMPGRAYYLSDEPELKEIRSAYRNHIRRMLSLAGDDDQSAASEADNAMAFETTLAKGQWTIAEASDPVATDNHFTLVQLQALAPEVDWKGYFVGNGTFSHLDSFTVAQPAYFQALSRLVTTTPLSVWKTYLRYQLLTAYAPYLNQAFIDENFAFDGRQLRGIREDSPRWKRGLDLVEESMGEALGRIYVDKYVSPQAKMRVTAMVKNFVTALDQEIDSLAWMTPATRAKAKEKLLTLRAKIGYPDHWRDYSTLKIVSGDLVGNVQRARSWEYRRNVNKLGKPVDRDEWYITPQTADAYEWLPQNEIVIGAALLQPPFFNADADDAVNYGAIGGTIGHEMSHGFDNIGSQYDGNGVLLGKPGWFTTMDQQRFDSLTHALVDQYSKFEPLPGYHVNGDQTLSENIADVSGAAIAYRAYHLSLGDRSAPVIDGLTGDQRFFIGWAQRRRGNYRDKELIRIIKSDEHSPPAIRAMAPLMNLDAFYPAFNIKAGDKMYLPPTERVHIW